MKLVPERILDAMSIVLHHAQDRIGASLSDAGTDLAPTQARCLSFIYRNPACTEADIVRESGRDKGQIARLVSTLTARGYLERLPDQPHERKRRIRLTVSGVEAQQVAEQVRAKVAEQLVATFKGDEQKSLLELLELLCDYNDLPKILEQIRGSGRP